MSNLKFWEPSGEGNNVQLAKEGNAVTNDTHSLGVVEEDGWFLKKNKKTFILN